MSYTGFLSLFTSEIRYEITLYVFKALHLLAPALPLFFFLLCITEEEEEFLTYSFPIYFNFNDLSIKHFGYMLDK